MNKYVKLKINKKDYILKPIIACIMMGISSIFTYNTLLGIISEKLCTIISIFIAIVVYIILIFLLRIFSKNNIYMIPYGNKIYKVLKLLRIYND